jgi:predicted ArsR family transcriptional regulator
MLSKLFGSKARVKLLKIFLSYPEKRFYIRQLARDLKLQVNSVRRELDNLEKIRINFLQGH